VVEILAALYGRVLKIPSHTHPDRDRFILSKGHAGMALYAALVLNGTLPEGDLDSFCGNDSLLGIHPEAALRGIDFSTGSLGLGLSMAAGAALAARLQRSNRRVFCLISDAECNEGSVWEAAMFAGHHGLDNLRVIIDLNGQQALGLTRDVINIPNMQERWQSFGWRTCLVNGHSIDDLALALSDAPRTITPPLVVLARTVFGKGVSYMDAGVTVSQRHLPDRAINWHYLPMRDAEYEIAMSDLERQN
jgi:transketolase